LNPNKFKTKSVMTKTSFKPAALLTSLVCMAFLFQACDPFGVRATGDDVTQTFDETNFHGLDLSVPARVKVRTDSVFKVEITCEETAMAYLETRVSDGILHIYFDRNVFDVDDMEIVVSAPSWDDFDVSGSGDIEVIDPISGETLRVEVSGSGSVHTEDAAFEKAILDVSGSGNIDLEGVADELRCDVSGSGDVDCLQFPVKTADLRVSGSGSIKVDVSDYLEARVSGSGDVFYQGSPTLNVDISGSGKVRKL
jgi:hypothetical protein